MSILCANHSPDIEPINDKNTIMLRNEIDKLHTELKKKSLEFDSLYGKLKALDDKYKKEETNNEIKEKMYKTKITKLNNQLTGAVRRINYLVDEKSKLNKGDSKHINYISKLEMQRTKNKESIICMLREKQSDSMSAVLEPSKKENIPKEDSEKKSFCIGNLDNMLNGENDLFKEINL